MSYYASLLKRQYSFYPTVDSFLAHCAEYVKWAEETPLQEEKIFSYEGAAFTGTLDKMRALSKPALCAYLNIPVSRLNAYKERGGAWEDAILLIEQVIYAQTFEGAAAGLLNASLITRSLGLADRQDLTSSDGSMATKPTVIEFVAPQIDNSVPGAD